MRVIFHDRCTLTCLSVPRPMRAIFHDRCMSTCLSRLQSRKTHVVSSYKVHVTATLFSDFVALCVREATAPLSLRRRDAPQGGGRTNSTTTPKTPPTVAEGTQHVPLPSCAVAFWIVCSCPSAECAVVHCRMVLVD